ncbi:glycosyltransferase family protein [Sphingorhabdus lacus]|uniref:glycosyltransferase family protein n=1 Tax=Sphingorhabdus lacus TaxID=392610 RepID=UPI00359403E4
MNNLYFKESRIQNAVISAKSLDLSISWTTLWDFVNIIAGLENFVDINIGYRTGFLSAPNIFQHQLKKRGLAFEATSSVPDQINMSLVVCRSPDDLQIIKSLPAIRDRSRLVAAYVLDSYFHEGYPLDASDYDVIFVTDEDDVDFVKRRYGCKVECVWQGVDAEKWRSTNEQRSIDITGFGRMPSRYHRAFQNEFHQHDSNIFYLHSPIGHREGVEVARERAMFFKVLQNTSISLAFHLMFEPEFQRPRSKMLTARWLESLVSGCLVLGKAPDSPTAANMLCWENATIDIENDEALAIKQIRDILGDRQKMKHQRELNVSHMIKLHDWRRRIRQITEALGI